MGSVMKTQMHHQESLVPSRCEPGNLLCKLVELTAHLSPNLALLDESKLSIAIFLPKGLQSVHVLLRNSLHLASAKMSQQLL